MTGSATLDFTAAGKDMASVVITGQGAIAGTSKVEAWLRLVATADHSVDDLLVDPIDVYAGDIVPGTGFTIYGVTRDFLRFGTYTIDWVWV